MDSMRKYRIITMRGTVLFVIVAIVCYQHAYSQEVGSENKETLNPVSLTTKPNLQSWGDVKEHNKHVTSNAWNSINEFARTTKDKIIKWAENIRNHEKEVRKSFQEHVDKIKAHAKMVIQNIIKTAKYTKQCLQSDKPAIDEVLKGIVRDAVICMAEHLKKIPPLGNETYEVLAGDTKFTEEMENKLNLCLKNENVEECMQNVRKEAFDEMENRENDIIKTRMDTRNIDDDILTNITFCSAKGIMDASNAIAKEIERIIACVKEEEIN